MGRIAVLLARGARPGEVRKRATPRSASTSSTSTTAPGSIRCRCPRLGQEGAGVVEAVGPGVTRLAPGDRVAYAAGRGAYAEVALVPASRVVAAGRQSTETTAAAMMLKGMTVEYLIRRDLPRWRPATPSCIHAAAGGVGLIACQWAKAWAPP